MTNYYWPTWADIIAREIPESYNYGQAGAGNLYISNQVTEANLRYKFNQDDLIMIMWSSISREDRYKGRGWITPGNIYTQGYFDDKFVDEWADSRGYLIRDLGLITMCKGMLDNLGIRYEMLNMAPFVDIQFSKPHPKFVNGHDVLEFYKGTISSIKPDLLTFECNGTWPQHPIKGPGQGQTADYHPSPAQHASYLKKLYAGIQFSPSTEAWIIDCDQIVLQTRLLTDIQKRWPKPPLVRL